GELQIFPVGALDVGERRVDREPAVATARPAADVALAQPAQSLAVLAGVIGAGEPHAAPDKRPGEGGGPGDARLLRRGVGASAQSPGGVDGRVMEPGAGRASI